MFRKAVIVLVAVMLLPALASAQPKPWLQVGGGFNTHTMGDVNNFIDIANLAGGTIDNVNKGFSFHGAFGVDVAPKFAVGVSYDRMMANGKGNLSDMVIEFDMPANLIRGFGQYQLVKAPNGAIFAEVGLGMVSTAGKVKATGFTDSEYSGSAVTFDGNLGGELAAGPQVSFVGTIGYRAAKIEDVKDQAGDPFPTISGANGAFDYSGLAIRAGLKLAFMK
jgi:hypothetical protein